MSARSSKDFSNPRKLGFMRLIEISYIIEVAFVMLMLVFLTKNEASQFDASDYVFFVTLILKSVTLWLIAKRKKALLLFMPIACLVEFAYDFVYQVLMTGSEIGSFLVGELWLVVVLVYILTSRRMKAVMTQPFNTETKDEIVEEERSIWNPRTLAFWRNMIIYFCVFSVVGHWMEAGYCTLIRFGIMPGTYDPNSQIWSDWLYPFMVYGVGFCVCGLLLFPVKMFFDNHVKGRIAPLALSFVVNTLACAVIELVLGLTQNADLQLWDYSNMFMNFMGQICLVNSLMFGAVATIMTWLVYPLCEKALRALTPSGSKIAFVVVVLIYVFLMCLYYINADGSASPHFDDYNEPAIEQTTGEAKS